MKAARAVLMCLIPNLLFVMISICCAQSPVAGSKVPQDNTGQLTKEDIQAAVEKGLQAQEKNQDFQLSLGIGSLITGPDESDYTETNNILNSTNLGRAVPQYLVGLSLRTPFPNFHRKGNAGKSEPVQQDQLSHFPNAAAKTSDSTSASLLPDSPKPNNQKSEAVDSNSWRQHPWKGFISIKFTSGASQTINGYVLGGSYQLARYLDALVGFALTPFNEASPGFRVAASQYVAAQQKLGNDLNFDPAAMLKGTPNAFDGFSLLDGSGHLIYEGTPLETHYHGGVIVGVSIPISLKAALGG